MSDILLTSYHIQLILVQPTCALSSSRYSEGPCSVSDIVTVLIAGKDSQCQVEGGSTDVACCILTPAKKIKAGCNNPSFTRDKCWHLKLCLHLMEPKRITTAGAYSSYSLPTKPGAFRKQKIPNRWVNKTLHKKWTSAVAEWSKALLVRENQQKTKTSQVCLPAWAIF